MAKNFVTNLNVKDFRWFLLRWIVCVHVALSCVEARTPFLLSTNEVGKIQPVMPIGLTGWTAELESPADIVYVVHWMNLCLIRAQLRGAG